MITPGGSGKPPTKVREVRERSSSFLTPTPYIESPSKTGSKRKLSTAAQSAPSESATEADDEETASPPAKKGPRRPKKPPTEEELADTLAAADLPQFSVDDCPFTTGGDPRQEQQVSFLNQMITKVNNIHSKFFIG
jgi:hypothetical protein